MRKTLCVILTFWCCATVYADNWLWTEDFSTGMNGWVNQVSNAWYIGSDGKLTYSDIGSYGRRNLRFPEPVSLDNGFKISVHTENFNLSSTGCLGVMFSSNEAMDDFFYFRNGDYEGTLLGQSIWGLNHSVPGMNYNYAWGNMTTPGASRILEVEFDGDVLGIYIDGDPIHSYTFPGIWGFDITDGYIGLSIWDSGSYPASVKINSISYVPEPSTLLLLGLGAVMLRRKC